MAGSGSAEPVDRENPIEVYDFVLFGILTAIVLIGWTLIPLGYLEGRTYDTFLDSMPWPYFIWALASMLGMIGAICFGFIIFLQNLRTTLRYAFLLGFVPTLAVLALDSLPTAFSISGYLAALMMGFAMVCTVGGIYWTYRVWCDRFVFRENALEAEGRVLRKSTAAWQTGEGSDSEHLLVIEFMTDSVPVTISADVRSDLYKKYTDGSTLRVAYMPGDPKIALVEGEYDSADLLRAREGLLL